MTLNNIQESNDELNSMPLLMENKRDCKFNPPLYKAKQTYAKIKLIIAICLCFLFFLAEIIGGILANSLAILTDSAHLFGDLMSFLISLGAMYVSSKKASKSMNFGWHRAEIIGALFSILLIWAVTGVLVYAAIMRIYHPTYEINAKIMLIMSGVGVIINVILALVLHPHSHTHSHDSGHGRNHMHGSSEHLLSENSSSVSGSDSSKSEIFKKIDNINLRAAFVHVIGDIIQSFGVLAAAFVIYFKPDWKIADPICTFLFSCLVIFTTTFIFRDIMYVLLECKPRHISFNAVEIRLNSVNGVVEIHHLRMWCITLSRTAIACHLVVDSSCDSQHILKNAYEICIDEFNFSEITIQIEAYHKKNSVHCDQ